VITGLTDFLTSPTVPVGSLVDKYMELQEPVMGSNMTGNRDTHHIYPDDGDRHISETLNYNSIFT
jgi:hypothetical protein